MKIYTILRQNVLFICNYVYCCGTLANAIYRKHVGFIMGKPLFAKCTGFIFCKFHAIVHISNLQHVQSIAIAYTKMWHGISDLSIPMVLCAFCQDTDS